MIYTPDPELAKHLEDQAVKMPEGGYLLDDAEWTETWMRRSVSHPNESYRELEQGVAYFLIWKHYGVPQNSTQRGIDLTNSSRVQAMHEATKRIKTETLPALQSAVVSGLSGVQSAVNETAVKLDDILGKVQAQGEEAERRNDRWRMAVSDTLEHWDGVANRLAAKAKKAVIAVLVMLGLLLAAVIALGILSLRAHAQIDVIQFQDSGGSVVKTFGGPFKIKCSTNLTCTASGSTLTMVASSTGSVAWSALTAGTNSNAGTFAMSGNTLDLTAATIVKLRVAGGLTSSANGDLGYDTTNKNWHIWANAVDNFAAVVPVSVSITNGHLATWSLVGGVLTLNDGGAVPAAGVSSVSGDGSLITNSGSTGAVTLTVGNVLAHKFWGNNTGSTQAGSFMQLACADLSNAGTLCSSSAALAANTTATAHNFFTAYNSTTGAFTKAQPVCGDLSDAGSLCTSSATLAQTIAATASNWLRSYDAGTGLFTKSRPVCADLSDAGTLCTSSTDFMEEPASNGLVAKTAANTSAARTISTADSTHVSVSNGDGVSGNPTLDTGSNIPTQASNGAANQIATYSGANKALVPATTLPTAAMPALTGAVTTSAGAVATSPGKIDVLDSSRFCQAAGASSTTYTCNLSPAITAYVTGTHYGFKADVANTAASTINFNAQGAKTIKKASGGITTDLAANDMQAGQWVDLVYDGTNMQMQSTLGNAAAGSGTVTNIATTSPITGGPITNTGTIACATCVVNNAANTYTGGGLQDLGSDSLRTTGREGIGGAELSTNRLALYADHNTERVFRITDTNAGPYDTWELDNGYNINSNGLGWYNVTNAEIPFWINHSNSILMGMGTRDGIGDIGLVTQNRPNNVYAKAKVETKLLADPSTAGYKGSLSAAMVGDGRLLYDAACSSSSSPTNATSSTGAFTSADVGKVFAIAHGGTGGKLLSTTVSSVTNSTTIVMATSCVTTTSADWAVVGTDNSAAMKAQTDAMHDLTPSGLDPGGGLLKVGAGIYVMKTTWTPKTSQGWITIQGTGPSSTLFVFVPVCTCSTANNNDRPFSVDFTSISTRRQIANAIAKGATTFTLSSAPDGSDLVAGEWLIIAEYDTLAGGGEPIAIDWVQVVSVVTTTVTVKHPFRTAFSVGRTYSNAAPLGGLGFVRATNDVFQNVAFKDFGIVQPDSGTAMPSIAIGYSIGSTVDNVWVDNPNGQNFYCYRGKDVTFTRNRSGSSKISNEVAACVDVMMDNNVFGGFGSAVSNYQVASSSAFTVDDGTAFFSFTNNKLPESADIAIQATRGVHDGIIKDNQVGWVRNGGTGQGQAIVCQGCLYLTIEGNTFAGGDGTNTGVSLANTTTLNVQINSSGNIVGVNKFGTFTNVYGTMLAADSYFTLIGTEYQIVPQPGTSGAVKLYDSGGVNAITDQTSGTITSYTVNRPLAATSGALINVNSSNTITQSFSGDSAHSLSQLAKTAAVTTFTLCAATAGTACGQAGQYRISYNFYGSGTACSSVTAGSVGLNLTWTDTNAVTHTTISMPLWDQKAAAMTNGLFNFNTALTTESASGSYIISTNGTIIQAATTYTSCTTGTGTYNLKMTVEQLQ